MVPPSVKWEELMPDDLMSEIVRFGVCYLAYGLAEPHGHYNALGLDWLKAYGICVRAAEKHGGIVAPPMCWHVAEIPFFPWFESRGVTKPLASSIPPTLFLHNVLYQIRAADARGFKVALLVTGHNGGVQHDMRLLCEFYTRVTGSPMRLRALFDGEAITETPYRGDHAGICETSQLMYIRPECVDLSRVRRDDCFAGTAFGHDDNPMPSADLGRQIVESQIEWFGETSRRMLSEYEPVENWQAPDTMRTEELWTRFECLTRKYWVMSTCLKDRSEGRAAAEFPGWEALGM